MKHKTYLSPNEVVSLYLNYNQSLNLRREAMNAKISYSAARRWISDIEASLAGETVYRGKGGHNLTIAVKKIRQVMGKSYVLPDGSGKPEVKVEQVTDRGAAEETRTPGEQIEYLMEQLRVALGEYAFELAQKRYDELTTEAKKTNVIGFIKSRWDARG